MQQLSTAAARPSVEMHGRAPDISAQATASTPQTWAFQNSITGAPISVTCMRECDRSHDPEMSTPTNPSDIYCRGQLPDSSLIIPVDSNTGVPEDSRILSAWITVEPFARDINRRLPHAVVEITDEHYISPLDPDLLAVLIDGLDRRLAALRRVHAQLCDVRAEYVTRTGDAA
ncbi:MULTISPECIES: DUF6907 domain-containing protein [Streptomyces]|uniref:DUF6907 domain-containing protein n=1 Tax=Streptomyces TaxID=1883 RepID=UPI0033EEBCB0